MRTPLKRPVNRITWRELIVTKDGHKVQDRVALKLLQHFYDHGNEGMPKGCRVEVPVPSPWVIDNMGFPLEEEDAQALLKEYRRKGKPIMIPLKPVKPQKVAPSPKPQPAPESVAPARPRSKGRRLKVGRKFQET